MSNKEAGVFLGVHEAAKLAYGVACLPGMRDSADKGDEVAAKHYGRMLGCVWAAAHALSEAGAYDSDVRSLCESVIG